MRFFPRTWLQFSLRTFLVLITVAAFVGGLAWIKYRDDRDFEARREHWLSIGYKLEVEETPVWLGMHTRRKIVGLWTDDQSHALDYTRIQLSGVELERDLERVSIMENRLPDEMCAALATLPKLKKLELFDADVTSQTIEKLSHLPKLTHLGLYHCKAIEKDGVGYLLQFSSLQELSLDTCLGISGTLYQLQIPSLKSLNITSCFPNEFDLSKNGLGKMPQLELLVARSNQMKVLITDGTILKLRVLDLRDNPLERLTGLAQAAPELEYLFIDEDDLSPLLIADIQQSKSLKKLIIGAGPRITSFYHSTRAQVKSRLPEIAAKFAVPVILEDDLFSKVRHEPAVHWPGQFEPELPFVQAASK